MGNLADHSGRFRTLTFVHPLSFQARSPLPDFHLPAPLFETLIIYPLGHVGYRNPLAGVNPKVTLSPPPTIFAESLPSLRVLRVNHLTIWPTNRFHDLSVLCLTAQRNLEHSMDQLLGLFQCSPGLRDILPEQGYVGSSGTPARGLPDVTLVPLDNLQRLYVSGFAHHGISRLLSLIQLSTTNDVAIGLDTVEFPPQQNRTIHDIFPLNYPPEHRVQAGTGSDSGGYPSAFLSTKRHLQLNTFIPQALRQLFRSPLPAVRGLWIESSLMSRSAIPKILPLSGVGAVGHHGQFPPTRRCYPTCPPPG